MENFEINTLVSIGFIAWSLGKTTEAGKIFQAVRLERPNDEASAIGTALVETTRGDPEQATRILRRAPPTDAVRAFLGVALLALGDRTDAIATLTEVAETAGDAPAGRMARSTLAVVAEEAKGQPAIGRPATPFVAQAR